MAQSPGGREVGRVSIRALPNTADFRPELKKFLDQIESDTTLQIRLGLDLEQARADLRAFQSEMDGRNVDLGVNAETGEADAKIDEAARKRKVPLSVSVDKVSLAKAKTVLAALFTNNPLTSIVKALPKISAISLGIGSIGSVALVAVRGLIGLITQLGQLGPLVALLPGLLVGAGLGFTALIVALKDAPARLGSTLTAYQGLQKVISNNFWSKATVPIKQLLTSLLPGLKSGFASVSTSLGSSIGGIATALKSAFAAGGLQSIFTGLQASIAAAAPGLRYFSSAFVSLLSFGAKYLPAFGRYITEVGTHFSNWVTGAEATGQLNSDITTALGLLHSLREVGHDISQIFKGIFLSGSGANPFGALNTGLAAVAKVVNSNGFQTALVTIFAGASTAAHALGLALGPVGAAIGKLSPTIGGVLESSGKTVAAVLTAVAAAVSQPAFQKGLGAFFAGIQKGLLAIAPSLPAVGKALGDLGGLVGEVAANVGPVLGQAISVLAPAVAQIVKGIGPILPTLSAALVTMLRDLAPYLPIFVKSLLDLLPPLAQFLANDMPTLTALLQVALPLIATFLQYAVLPLLQALSWLVSLGTPIATLFDDLLDGANPAKLALGELTGKFGPLVQALGGFGAAVGVTMVNAGRTFIGIVNDFITAIDLLIIAWNSFANGLKKLTGGAINLTLSKIPLISSGGATTASAIQVPKAATGMTVSPRPGVGTLVDVAEGIRSESIVDTGNVNQMIDNTNRLLAKQSAAKTGGDVYIDKIVAPDSDPRVSGRVMGAEFVRLMAGTP